MFKSIEPEVAGGFGEETVFNTATHPPEVYQLHYEFQGWLRNDILEVFPCFIVTEELRDAIKVNRLTGVIFDGVTVSTSQQFRELYPVLVLPKFYWMKVSGKAEEEDFGISDKFLLIVSEEAFQVLSRFNINAADIRDFP